MHMSTAHPKRDGRVKGRDGSSVRNWPTYAALVDLDEGTALEFTPAPHINGVVCAKLEAEDIEEEVSYWQNVVLCCVLGANPPYRFPELDIKYWGLQSLSKLGSMLGIPLKTDKFTKEKSMLKYARLLVEMPLDGSFPDYIEFANENNVLIRQPLKCCHCKMFGHTVEHCRRNLKGGNGGVAIRHIIKTSMGRSLVGFLETKVKEQNMAQVVRNTCYSWHWEHNATSNDKGRILICWHPKAYQF
ncbi:hypothetical protein Cgig2_030511 [Carnegiea gigantea]|uniref:DUF4283 domain-containing protein n=1 Tax=Carnegiea gigantea TaxID=171969 RepID=A0A9Q1GI29_9CARY|nr:hypothetical protein Cgig2_030511 [Carnegiea gigantea]